MAPCFILFFSFLLPYQRYTNETMALTQLLAFLHTKGYHEQTTFHIFHTKGLHEQATFNGFVPKDTWSFDGTEGINHKCDGAGLVRIVSTFFSKFRGNNRKWMFISGVNDIKFITGVINTAEQLSPVTTTLANNYRRCQRHRDKTACLDLKMKNDQKFSLQE